MAKLIVRVCDKCESQDGVETYEVKRKGAKGRPLERDLCITHKKQIEDILGLASASKAPVVAPAAKKAARSRTSTKKVMTMEEVEALKKK